MSFSIAGKTAVVTGAANGVGLAIARHFVEKGARVMFADMDEERLQAELGSGTDEEDSVAWFAGDLRQKLTLANLLSATLDRFDRVDILVNGSRKLLVGDPLDSDEDGFEATLQQNLLPTLRVTQTFARRMIRQAEEDDDDAPAGSIINLSSIAARRTQPGLMAFSVTSAAIDQLTRSMAVSLAPHRIRVNGIALGSVMTTGLQSSLKSQDDLRGRILAATPLNRIASASEVAEVAHFLASEASGFMTGRVLTVDGGRTLVDAADAPAH
ncbi:SDR family oxidoreductase [Silicimonas algicola]|uniref:7-alpha-hydroxysteroid dehydrogenase n=1 Tax=Silicimonas algicola TaxID=1826607 RepID=A0A316G7J8_9RHOB|nr:SDR family oxidoreductase [Silicimonas algicola]AZQ67271.1 SDR family oxidoreductase [Silicimonas algicola]PWK56939.1 7-alpha-hydroxysteroid dehydrogenase [Silicimonas algicola]